jgi:hypothetical protein
MINYRQEHADDLRQLRSLVELIPQKAVANAFVASLGSRRLTDRSALGSYAFVRSIPAHDLAPLDATFATVCGDCGWSKMPPGHEHHDADTQSHYFLERSKYGGVRHVQPQYALFDLNAFQSDPPSIPTSDDWKKLTKILQTPKMLELDSKPSDLEGALKSVFRSNKNERRALIQILAYASVLEDPLHPGYLDGYIVPEQRAMPPHHFLDWGYPTIWWRARFGYRTEAVRFWFPEVLELLSE